jgi:hypothetical protein
MGVQQPGDDQFAAGVDRLPGISGDAGSDRCDAPGRNRDISNRVERCRRIDDAAALDHQNVAIGRCPDFA